MSLIFVKWDKNNVLNYFKSKKNYRNAIWSFFVHFNWQTSIFEGIWPCITIIYILVLFDAFNILYLLDDVCCAICFLVICFLFETFRWFYHLKCVLRYKKYEKSAKITEKKRSPNLIEFFKLFSLRWICCQRMKWMNLPSSHSSLIFWVRACDAHLVERWDNENLLAVLWYYDKAFESISIHSYMNQNSLDITMTQSFW